MKLNLRDVHRPLSFVGRPFFGLLATRRAIEMYPINIDPDYQRGHVWSVRQQELFIGHLLEGGAVQPCVVNQGPYGDWEVAELVDGKQRVTACLRWAVGEISAELWDGRRIHVSDLDVVGQRACDLKIGLEYGMVRLSREECLELYIRLNRGGTPHTEEEIERVRQLLAKEKGE